ncbi:MAG: RICIN domain-containing protein [Prevotella sp.]|nr:RICIN domain-containing protein [Prevotella sp.]
MKKYMLCAALSACSLMAVAQSGDRPATSSGLFLSAAAKRDVLIPFSIQAEGKRFTPTWGLDVAWIPDQWHPNVQRGINFMGKENIGIGRSAFRFDKPLINDSVLANSVIDVMRQRSNELSKVSTTLPIVFTADQEAGASDYFVKNKSADIEHWAAMINSHVRWMQQNTNHPVTGISPFNEGDYWTVEEGATAAKQGQVAKLLKEKYPRCADIAMVGGNTLNDDYALLWCSSGKDYYDWGNTHQLAGSFANYARFHEWLASEGKVGYNDEMHNVGEAMIGLEYGMTVGIWWGFDSRARGEFCDISRHGVRLAYGEHRNNWTAASVYRHDDTNQVKAFIGSSERQAVTTSYQFLSLDRPVYFDGYGPSYEQRIEIPGGTGYQQGQTNAERVVDVTWGEDVQPYPIDGVYKIMNKATLRVVAENGTADGNTNISQMTYTGQKNQQWSITPVTKSTAGDLSFYNIKSENDNKFIDVLNFSLGIAGNLISYGSGQAADNQQWYLEYAGDGYFYIRSRWSALYMTLQRNERSNGVNIYQYTLLPEANRDRQLWRIIPLDADCETEAPAQPMGLTATGHGISVELQWEPNTESDLSSYSVLRAERGTEEWNTIARQITETRFVDNSCRPGHEYIYKVKAIDRSANQSQPSEAVAAAVAAGPLMMGHWEFDGNSQDQSGHLLDAALVGTPSYVSSIHKTGTHSVTLDGSQYIQLPYGMAASDELTVAFWVYWNNSSLSGQRLFDFGNDPMHHFYLAANAGSGLHFGIRNGGVEQAVSGTKLSLRTWQHVAVSIGREETAIYVDGTKVGSSTGLTVSPGDVNPLLNYIGHGLNTSDVNLRANLDDLRIFNYALDGDAVRQVMDNTYIVGVDTPQEKLAVPAAYYSPDGKRFSQPRQGLNIIKYTDGRTDKVIR